jgi:PPM family protein phosphatase
VRTTLVPISLDVCAAQHQGDRKEQQDRVAVVVHPKRAGVVLAVLADGMGGHTGGALAAEQVVHTATTNFDHFAPAEESPETLLGNALAEAHAMIKSSRFINEKEPHSTAVLLLMQPGKITWAHCGDSRLHWFRGTGLVARTVDHSYVESLVASGRITPEAALTHPNRNVLTTSLGGRDTPKIDFGECHHLLAGDSFLLSSDGLWAYFEEDELARIVAGNPARRASEILIELARERAGGSGDNLSLAIIKLVEVAAPAKKPRAPAGSLTRV